MTNQKWKKSMAFLLGFIVFLGTLLYPVGGKSSEKEQVSRTIGIVFDNSGSMYIDGELAWCRATYSIEVIASMMNAGDVLQVYPMHPIDVDGVEYSMDDPLIINGPEEAEKIRDILTPIALGTPIETITAAYKGLQKAKTDEKWLIVLTDGQTFYENEIELSYTDTQTKLSELLTNYAAKMNIIYLGIGSNLLPPQATGKTKYMFRTDIASVSGDVLKKLTEISNLIFGRDQLNVTGKDISFDVTLSKLILFIQGNNINNVQIIDEDGNLLSESTSSQTRYSEKGSGNRGATVDASLQGVMNVYENLDAGNFEISYTGDMSSVGVYYEPDVDLKLSLFDLEGNEINVSEPVYSGDYELRFELVDANGNTTTSRLLGNTHFTVDYKLNGTENSITSDEPGAFPIRLEAGMSLNGKITCDYLNGYSVTKTFAEMDWPSGGLKVDSRPLGSLKAIITDSVDSIQVSGNMSTLLGNVSLYYNDVLIQGEEVAKTALSAVASPDHITFSVIPGTEGYSLILNEPADPRSTIGEYTIALVPEYTDVDGQLVTGDEITLPFIIEDLGNLKVELSNPVSEIKTSELEGVKVGDLTIYYEEEPLIGEQLAMTEVTISTEPGDISFSAQRTEKGFELILDPLDDPVKAIGEFVITVTPQYTNPDQFLITGSKLQIPFKVEDNRRGIDMEVIAPQKFFQIFQVADGEPITVKVNRDGDVLIREEMAVTTLTVEAEGLQFQVVPDNNASSFIVKFSDGQSITPGKYDIHFLVSSFNELGQEIYDTDNLRIELQYYPEWLPRVLTLAGLVILIILIILFLRAKVLPKKISIDTTSCEFTVDGNRLKAVPRVDKYTRKGKKGTLQVISPRAADNIQCETGYTLTLEAISPRITKSAKRMARVTKIAAYKQNTIRSIEIKNREMVKNMANGKLEPADGGKFKPVDIRNGSDTLAVAKVLDPETNREITVKFEARLRFK